jgi:two-component system cell cycle response regulator
MNSSSPPRRRTLSDLPDLYFEEGDVEATVMSRLDQHPPPRAARQQACFIVVAGTNVGETFRLQEGAEVVLGRGTDVSFRLNDDGVSRRHARARVGPEGVMLYDLKSANGTVVNGEKIDEWTLSDGDKIQLGSTTILKFTYQDELDEAFQRNMLDAAQRDGLTRAFNKGYFVQRLETEMAYTARHGVPLSLIMLDLDHFKQVNDTYGHPTGDAVLVQLSKLIHAQLRAEDVFARYGGEEFALLCRGTSLDEALLIGERIRVATQNTPFAYEGRTIQCTVSIGVAAFTGAHATAGIGWTPASLIERADKALYAAKHGGRNRVVRGS